MSCFDGLDCYDIVRAMIFKVLLVLISLTVLTVVIILCFCVGNGFQISVGVSRFCGSGGLDAFPGCICLDG